MKNCLILGGGGHAKVLIETMLSSIELNPAYILDQDPKKWKSKVLNVEIIGGDDQIRTLKLKGIEYFAIGLGSVKDNSLRKKLYDFAISEGLKPATIIHPSAILSPSAKISKGCQILLSAVINSDAFIGENAIINTGSIVEHDCFIKNHIHISIGAKLASSVFIDDLAFIGAGSVIKQGIKIGKASIIGAGSVVVKDVAPFKMVFGNPAKEKKI